MAEYIEREATLNALRNLGSRDYRRAKGTIADAMKIIMHSAYTPTADVAEVKHGEWIGRPLCGNSNCRCSICGSWWNVHANLNGEISQKYCPNCGARMDGEGE